MINNRTLSGLCAGLIASVASIAFAQAPAPAAAPTASPVGLWKTVDDASGKEKSLIRITETGGVLTGKVEKTLDPSRADAKCDDCTDARKGQPILGMTLLRNVKKAEGDKALWEGGDILDPTNGKIYRVRLTPSGDNKKLEVRGYVGAPMFGRSQTWLRVE